MKKIRKLFTVLFSMLLALTLIVPVNIKASNNEIWVSHGGKEAYYIEVSDDTTDADISFTNGAYMSATIEEKDGKKQVKVTGGSDYGMGVYTLQIKDQTYTVNVYVLAEIRAVNSED